MRLRRIGMALLACLGAGGWPISGSALAAESDLVLPLQPGQDLEGLSRQYYGKARWVPVLVAYNGLASASPEAGTPIRLPHSPTHTVEPGDTWSKVAARYWKRPGGALALARLNDRRPGNTLQVGDSIRVPILIPDRMQANQTLAAISRRYYGVSSFWPVLKALNAIDDPREIRPGDRIVVPVILERKQMAPAARAASSPPPRPTLDPKDARELEAGIQAYREGRYARALEALESASKEILARGNKTQKQSLLRYLAFSYVAYDRKLPACSTFRKLEVISPDEEFDPEQVSPKILAVARSCDRL